MLLTIFKYLLPEIFKFLKYANSANDGIIHSTKFGSNMMKADISANLYQKSLILLSTILPNVLHKTSLTVLLPWQHIGFQKYPIIKAFLVTIAFVVIFANGTSFASSSKTYKYVALFNVFRKSLTY